MPKLTLAQLKDKLKQLKKTYPEIRLTENGVVLKKPELEALLAKYESGAEVKKPSGGKITKKKSLYSNLSNLSIFNKEPYVDAHTYDELMEINIAQYIDDKTNIYDIATELDLLWGVLWKTADYLLTIMAIPLDEDARKSVIEEFNRLRKYPLPIELVEYASYIDDFLNYRPDVLEEFLETDDGVRKQYEEEKSLVNMMLQKWYEMVADRDPKPSEKNKIPNPYYKPRLEPKKMIQKEVPKKEVVEKLVDKVVDVMPTVMKTAKDYVVPGYESPSDEDVGYVPMSVMRQSRKKSFEYDPYMELFKAIQEATSV